MLRLARCYYLHFTRHSELLRVSLIVRTTAAELLGLYVQGARQPSMLPTSDSVNSKAWAISDTERPR